MNETLKQNTNFNDLYTKSYRLAAAIFTVSNVISEKEELRTKIKNLSLELVSMSVKLKDINFADARKQLADIEKNSLELMSLLDIASLSSLISEMNAKILKEEFQSFISEITTFAQGFENTKNVSVKKIFEQPETFGLPGSIKKDRVTEEVRAEKVERIKKENGNGHRRKDQRKTTIFDFIKRHNNASIKDIAPHIVGCSEKTVQRELIELINEGRIGRSGERRWSKYYVVGN